MRFLLFDRINEVEPGKRLAAMRGLSAAGVPVMVNVSPIIPGLTDHEIESILAEARAHGASRIGHALLRLPGEVADLVQDVLAGQRRALAKAITLLESARADQRGDAAALLAGLLPHAGT